MRAYSDFEHLEVRVENGIAIVTFASKPEGEIEHSFFAEMRDIFGTLTIDTSIRAAVFTGKGEVFFGGVGAVRHKRLVAAGVDTIAGQLMTLKQIVEAILSFRKPVVAAVNGEAMNIGGQFALLMDAAVATPAAKFGDNHIAKGLAAGDGGTMLFPMLLGMARAREVLLHGKAIGAQEALELKLVTEIVAPESLLETAVATAERLAALPPMAYFTTKHSLYAWWRLSSMMSWDMAMGGEIAGLAQQAYS